MRRILFTVALVALALAAAVPVASGATKVREFRSPMYVGFESGGLITLEIVFKNKSSNKKLYTPRQVTSIRLESVPLSCSNDPGDPISQLSLTTTLATSIKVVKAPPPHASKPKPGRYAFRFSAPFDGFAGSNSGTIDKPNERPQGTPPRAHGTFTITDLDADPGHTNCASNGGRSWSAPRPEGE